MPAVPASDGGLHVLQVPLQRPPALGAAPASAPFILSVAVLQAAIRQVLVDHPGRHAQPTP